ncbi:MAG: hypothetical protein IAF94_20675 [Pirellulaceae bacterium]|nr:hypothetical protein [Pirellulaceae bacterium]
MVGGIVLAGFLPLIVHDMPRDELPIMLGLLGVCIFFCVAVGAFTFWAAMRMKALRSYSLAMSAVVVTFLVGFLACLPAMILGIWPLIVLLDGEVKACFDRPDTGLHP